MKRAFLKDISSSAIQVILNQGLGLLIFIITSRYLTKAVYGEFNWSLAILSFVTTILSLRLEQIIVRKVAAGDDPSKMLSLFAGHTLFFGLFFYIVLLLASMLFPSFFQQHDLLLLLAISQLLSFFSSPFKQLANGKEFFNLLAVMSLVSNLVRSAGLLWVVVFSDLTIQQVLIIYIFAALAELLVSFYIVQYRLKISVSSRWSLKDYFSLLNESLPQIGSVFLNACVARFDWILLGILSTTLITAEYSFAYKVFELCPFPMLILAPILLSRFSRYFSIHDEASLSAKKRELGLFIRYLMITATVLPLVLNVAWVPLMDALTANKYGAVNKTTFFLLSLCIPFQYMINLLWTIQFAQNQLQRIFRITAITSAVIITGDLLMIPLLNAKGAAIVYLLATAIEYIIYLRCSVLLKISESWQAMIICIGIALISGFSVEYIDGSLILKLLVAVIIYSILLLITKQVKRNDWQIIKAWI